MCSHNEPDKTENKELVFKEVCVDPLNYLNSSNQPLLLCAAITAKCHHDALVYAAAQNGK